MKIAIYDKWIESLGGGEKVATVMAEALSKAGHDVDLLSTFKPNKPLIEKKMAVDLSNVKMVALNERSYDRILKWTKSYDLFINTSFLDLQPSLAKKSIYYVHFPSQVIKTFLGFIKYETILPFLRRFLVIPQLEKGMERIDDINSRAGKWLGSDNTIIISNPPKKFICKLRIYSDLVSYGVEKDISVISNNAELRLVDKTLEHNTSTLSYVYEVRPEDKQETTLKILVRSKPRKEGLALVSLTINSPRFFLWNFLKRYLPRYEMALYGSGSFSLGAGLDTYNLFMSNSYFTKRWTKRYWGKDSVVVFPPVDVDKFKSKKNKKNIILNVGRFFVGGHSKRQDVLIEAFKELYDSSGVARSWELHLIGGIAEGWEHSEYVKKLEEMAEGYPVFFHFFADFETLKDLYASARIYWHATGFDQSPLRNPITLEHFGISVVEAMSSGCVPVVFRGGGLTETVDSRDGLTFKSVSQLINITERLIENPIKINRLSRKYITRARKYSRSRFEQRVLDIVRSLKITDEK